MEGQSDDADSRISQSDALVYWNEIPATANGMLGGYPQVSRIDLRGSLNFLAKLWRSTNSPNGRVGRAVDCGAGIGRITAGCLSKVCEIVDIVEPIEKFANEAKALDLGDCKLGNVYVTGMERWTPTVNYDIIWVQWCIGHLRDEQLVKFLMRSNAALSENGWIVVKENMSTDREGKDLFDEVDSTVTRTDERFRKLFGESGLKITRTELQSGFPKSLYPVRFYALQPSG